MNDLILGYFEGIDSAIEKLSNRKEKFIKNLPSWVMTYRNIYVGRIRKSNNFIISVLPNPKLEKDTITEYSINNHDDYQKIFKNQKIIPTFEIENSLKGSGALWLSDFSFSDGEVFGNTTSSDALNILISEDLFSTEFNESRYKTDAINFWNNAKNNLDIKKSYADNLRVVFSKFETLINRKSFMERRVHRYINEYSAFLLPAFKKCYFEKKLFRLDEYRVADFILEREGLTPPILIELERPWYNAFTTRGEPTAESNHARNQINEWIDYIRSDNNNIEGEMSFLNTNQMTRLVIIGRGIDHEDSMEKTKQSDTIIWTYHFLLKEAKNMCAKNIADQCKLIGVDINGVINFM